MEKNYDCYFDKLQRSGVNAERTVERFGGLADLYVKFLDEFAETDRFPEIYAAFKEKDLKKAEMASHKLKGVLGNLGMEELFAKSEEVMRDIRSNNTDEAVQKLRQMEPGIEKIKRIIKETPHES